MNLKVLITSCILSAATLSVSAQEWVNIWSLDFSGANVRDMLTTENSNLDFVVSNDGTYKNMGYYVVEETVGSKTVTGITTKSIDDTTPTISGDKSMSLSVDLGEEFYQKIGGYEFGKSVLKLSYSLKCVGDAGTSTQTEFAFGLKNTSDVNSPSTRLNSIINTRTNSSGVFNCTSNNIYGKNASTNLGLLGEGDNLYRAITVELVLDTTNKSNVENETFWFDLIIKDMETGDELYSKSGYISTAGLSSSQSSYLDAPELDKLNFGNYLKPNFDISNTGTIYSVTVDAYNIPEPSTYASLFAILALGFAVYRKRK